MPNNFLFTYTDDLKSELAPYLVTEPPGPLLYGVHRRNSARHRQRTVNFLVDLNAKLCAKKSATSSASEPGIQTPEETLASGAGSCRDSAWLLIQALRHIGLAARFVSGRYLVQLRPDIDPIEGPREVENDFTDLHAWARKSPIFPAPAGSAFETSPRGITLTGEGHVPVAATPHYTLGRADHRRRRPRQCRVPASR